MGVDHTAVIAFGVKVTAPDGTEDPEDYLEEVAGRYDLKVIVAGSSYTGDPEYVIGFKLGKVAYSGFERVDLAPEGSEPMLARVSVAAAIVKLKKEEKDLKPEGPGFYLGLWVH